MVPLESSDRVLNLLWIFFVLLLLVTSHILSRLNLVIGVTSDGALNFVEFFESLLGDDADLIVGLLLLPLHLAVVGVPAPVHGVGDARENVALRGGAHRSLAVGLLYRLFLSVKVLQLALLKAACLHVVRVAELLVESLPDALPERINPVLGGSLRHLVTDSLEVVIWVVRLGGSLAEPRNVLAARTR